MSIGWRGLKRGGGEGRGPVPFFNSFMKIGLGPVTFSCRVNL